MDKKDIYMKIIILIIGLGLFLVGRYILKLKDDNIIEEKVEQVIKDELGVEVDLTPLSPENS